MANVAEDLKDRSDPLELVVVGADVHIQTAVGGLRDAAPDGSVDRDHAPVQPAGGRPEVVGSDRGHVDPGLAGGEGRGQPVRAE